MTISAEGMIGVLQNPVNEGQLLSGLKQLKNCVIGHDEEKAAFIAREDVIPTLLDLCENGPSDDVRVEAIVILGSFAYGSDSVVGDLLKHPIVPVIQQTLERAHAKRRDVIVRACIRILAAILHKHGSGGVYMAEYPGIVNVLNELLWTPTTPSATVTQCCRLVPLLVESSKRNKAEGQNIPSLAPLAQCLSARISMLMGKYDQHAQGVRKSSSSLEAAIAALANIITPAQAKNLLSGGAISSPPGAESSSSGVPGPRSADKFIQGMVSLTRDDDMQMRLSAVELLTKLQEHAVSESQKDEMVQPLLPTLVPILDESLGEDPRVALALARICRDDEHSSAMAVEVDVVKKICNVLKTTPDERICLKSDVVANNLLALAGIGAHKDRFRSEITDNGGLGIINRIFALKLEMYNGDEDEETVIYAIRSVKTAACYVLRSLSRSVSLLRTSLSSTEIVDGIMEMLESGSNNTEDENKMDLEEEGEGHSMSSKSVSRTSAIDDSPEVRSAVMAAICNLILEFSPLQKPLIDKGLLAIIIDHAHSPHPPLRLNSVWALKHATFSASQEIKDAVLTQMGSSYLIELCHDPELDVQEQAMAFLRNLVCRNTDAVDRLFTDLGIDTVFAMIEEKLANGSFYDRHPDILVSTVYTLVHIAAGAESHRDLITQRDGMLRKLLPLLPHQDSELRVAIVWLMINLTWIEEDYNTSSIRSESCKIRAHKIAQLGFKEALQERSRDSSLDVRERTKTALFQIEGLLNNPSPSRA